MRLREYLERFINIINERAFSCYLKSLDQFAIVEHGFDEELSEEEWEEIKELLDELDD